MAYCVRPTERTSSVQTLGVEEGRLEVSLTGDLSNAIFSRQDLDSFVFVMATNATGRWSNVKDRVYLKHNMRAERQRARINSRKSGEEDRERAAAASGEQESRRDSTEHWMSWIEVSARERRWNNTEQCREARKVRALEKYWNTRKNWLRRPQNFARRDMMCSCGRRVAWFHQVTNKRNQTCFACLEELREGKHSGKKSLIRWSVEKIHLLHSSQLLLEVMAIGFTLKWTAKLW